MSETFDKTFWESHWNHDPAGERQSLPANPYLETELAGLTPGTALDAGSGQGAEAIWLAAHGWNVTGADISAHAISQAQARAAAEGIEVNWVEADLSTWQPDQTYDLVTTFYAHPEIPQLEFYDRIAEWVRPGGTLLIVGHLHTESTHHHRTPEHASARAASVAERLTASGWRVETAEERDRLIQDPLGRTIPIADFIVRATRDLT